MTLLNELSRISFPNAEIPAFDPVSKRVFLVKGGVNVEIIDLSDPALPTPIGTISGATLGGNPNSVAIKNGVVAIAVANNDPIQSGFVQFFSVNGPFTSPLRTISVGVLPDALTFSPDGRYLVVANEGERVDTVPGAGVGIVDPEGSVSVIRIPSGQPFSLTNLSTATVATATFTSFNGQEASLRAQGVRILPGTNAANDFEPEYISISPDSTTAFVALQENNTVAVVNLSTASVTQLLPLGAVNFNLPGNGFDPSDQDGGINIRNFPVFGLRQPDGIASFSFNGQTFFVTANEGDDGENRNNLLRVNSSSYTLDPAVFPDRNILEQNNNLGRLEVSTIDGNLDADPEFEQIFTFGSRSFSIFDANGNLVFDSRGDFEQITASLVPQLFNANSGSVAQFDQRSDDSGPEPEGIALGTVNGRTYAFIGLERGPGGVVVYDITNPFNATFVQYIRNDADIAPEGLQFISASDSPTGKPLLLVASEVSGTLTIFEASGQSSTPIARSVGAGTQLTGSNNADNILGTAGRDTIVAFGGNDTILGNLGDDSIDGGVGNDFILGGEGNDTLLGSFGDDTIGGGPGADIIFTGSGSDVVRFLNLNEGGDTIGDFADTFDRLAVRTTIASSFGSGLGQLNAIQQSANTIVYIENGIAGFQTGDVILATLINFAASNFTAADVTFF